MRIIIAGSSGFVGSALVRFLREQGHVVKRLVRSASQLSDDAILCESTSLEGCDAVVNLAGENVASGRWTIDKKKRILESRVEGTKRLCRQLAKLHQPPKILINASAMGFYGDRGMEILTEDSSGGDDFLAETCRQWEAAAEEAIPLGMRVVKLRIGLVLSSKGGALASMLTPFKLGLGGVLGSGKQYMSWIMLDDLLQVILYVLNHETLCGPINAATPNPVTNEEFTKTLGRLLHRPTLLTIPAFLLRIILGEMADALFLSGKRMAPMRLLASGYDFLHPELDQALKSDLKLHSDFTANIAC